MSAPKKKRKTKQEFEILFCLPSGKTLNLTEKEFLFLQTFFKKQHEI